MSEQITITVASKANVGKSTVAMLLADFLSFTGFEVDVNLLDGLLPEQIEENFTDRLDAMFEKGVKIVINEQQLSSTQYDEQKYEKDYLTMKQSFDESSDGC